MFPARHSRTRELDFVHLFGGCLAANGVMAL